MTAGVQKFAPGQIWKMRIDDNKNMTDTKFRPYLIIGSIKRRLILLKLTHGGEFSSNWIETIESKPSEKSNVILDCPIVTNVNDQDIKEYIGTLRYTDFVKIMIKFLSALIYESSYEDALLTDDSINEIRNTVKSHSDSMYSFGRFSTLDDVSKIITPIAGLDDESSSDSEDDVITESAEDVIDESAIDDEYDDVEEVDESDIEPMSVKRVYHRTHDTTIHVEDLIILGEGYSSLEDINKECEKFGIKDAKFELHNLCARNKCAYLNGKYNFTIKSKYNKDGNMKKKNRNFKKVRRIIVSDYEKFGAAITASIWDSSTNAIYYYTKTNERKS